MKIIYSLSIIFGLIMTLIGAIVGVEFQSSSAAIGGGVFVLFGVSMLFYTKL